jgi:hypothetical protein
MGPSFSRIVVSHTAGRMALARRFSCVPASPLAHTVSAWAVPVALDRYELR